MDGQAIGRQTVVFDTEISEQKRVKTEQAAFISRQDSC